MNYHQREFVAIYVHEGGGDVADAFELLKIAKGLTRLAEKHHDDLTVHDQNREERLVEMAETIATRAHMSVEYLGNPRGYVLQLVTAEGRKVYVP